MSTNDFFYTRLTWLSMPANDWAWPMTVATSSPPREFTIASLRSSTMADVLSWAAAVYSRIQSLSRLDPSDVLKNASTLTLYSRMLLVVVRPSVSKAKEEYFICWCWSYFSIPKCSLPFWISQYQAVVMCIYLPCILSPVQTHWYGLKSNLWGSNVMTLQPLSSGKIGWCQFSWLLMWSAISCAQYMTWG